MLLQVEQKKGLPQMRQPRFKIVSDVSLEDSEGNRKACHHYRNHSHQFNQDVE